MKKFALVKGKDIQLINASNSSRKFKVDQRVIFNKNRKLMTFNKPGHLDPDGNGLWLESKQSNNIAITLNNIPHVILEVSRGDKIIYAEYDFKTRKIKCSMYEIIGFKGDEAVCRGIDASLNH